MQALRNRLRYSTVIPAIVGAGFLASGSIVFASQGQGVSHQELSTNPAAVSRSAARSSSDGILVAAASNSCNPCAAKKANACNPCAGKNPCNPCAAKNPCNPCAAPNPCNPCAASAEAPELTPDQAIAAYKSVQAEMLAGYAKSGVPELADYTSWVNSATSPYVAATHGNRFVNNWVNDVAAEHYLKYEELGTMPAGSVIAKDSFTVNAKGKATPGPLFLMEKMQAGFAPDTGNWRYTMVMPDGAVFGRTNGKNSAGVTFCSECHGAVAEDQDYLMLLPEENRK